MNEIVTYGGHQLVSAADLRAQVNAVQAAMQAVMKDGVHYGKIPGTPKPSLWKPGAEVLFSMFRLATSYTIEDLSDSDVVRYRVRCTATHQPTSTVMGEGLGEASTGEEKYKWRKAGKREWAETPENRRRVKYGSSRDGDYEIPQVRTEAADLANTVLKMAAKRAQVACALNVTAASDIFSQDIEDLPPELLSQAADSQPGGRVEPPKPKRAKEPEAPGADVAATTPASAAMISHIFKRLANAKLEVADMVTAFPGTPESLEGITVAHANAILKWTATPPA